MDTTMVAPAKTAAPYDPALAVWVNEKLSAGVWRQEYQCPSSRAGIAPHRLTCDPGGERASCSCKGYATHGHCRHVDAAAAIVARTAADLYALFSLAELAMLDRDMRRQYGEDGLRGNVRYSELGTMVGARIAQQDVPATIARGKAAVEDLFSEAS